MRIGEKGNEVAGVGKAPRSPDKADPRAAKPGCNGDTDADGDAHDLSGLQEFRRGLLRDIMIIDNRQFADPLDPGIHDEVGRGFSPLGVHVVHMVVGGDLVPLFRHLEEMVPAQLLPDDAGSARSREPEVVGQFKTASQITLPADEHLHDLNEDARGIHPERSLRTGKDFVSQRPQGAQSVLCLPDIEGIQEMGNGVGYAQFPRGRHFTDAMGMKVRIQQVLDVHP